ncbi:MAG: winged helix-turn-helix transcriptional regulator, partial [Blautia sp.]|nr:winged helix-turn-helix transcriptional regulator [Blautia sp.]
KADKEPIKADKEPIKADKEPIKADKKAIKADRKKAIIKFISENDFITNKKARELLELADSTTKRILKEMVEEGTLTVEGERKARKYFLKK